METGLDAYRRMFPLMTSELEKIPGLRKCQVLEVMRLMDNICDVCKDSFVPCYCAPQYDI